MKKAPRKWARRMFKRAQRDAVKRRAQTRKEKLVEEDFPEGAL